MLLALILTIALTAALAVAQQPPAPPFDEWLDSIDRVLALDWDRVVAGHPRQGGIGTKEDVRNLKQHMVDLKEAVREPAAQGKCFDQAMKEIKLPKYESGAATPSSFQ